MCCSPFAGAVHVYHPIVHRLDGPLTQPHDFQEPLWQNNRIYTRASRPQSIFPGLHWSAAPEDEQDSEIHPLLQVLLFLACHLHVTFSNQTHASITYQNFCLCHRSVASHVYEQALTFVPSSSLTLRTHRM